MYAIFFYFVIPYSKGKLIMIEAQRSYNKEVGVVIAALIPAQICELGCKLIL